VGHIGGEKIEVL